MKKFLILFIFFVIFLCWPFYGWLAYEFLSSPFNTIAVIALITAELAIASFTLVSLLRLRDALNKKIFRIFITVLNILIIGYFFSLMIYFVI